MQSLAINLLSAKMQCYNIPLVYMPKSRVICKWVYCDQYIRIHRELLIAYKDGNARKDELSEWLFSAGDYNNNLVINRGIKTL